MKPSNYSNFANKKLGKYILKYHPELIEDKNFFLIKADIPMKYEEYYSMALLSVFLSFFVGLITGLILYLIFPSFLTGFLLLMLAVLIPLCVAGGFLYYPTYCVKKRELNINLYLPYAINFISSMAVAGISPAEIFETLSKVKVYGEVQAEAKKITKEISIMGVDNITALKHAIEVSPSRKFKAFIQGIIGTLQSGSDLHVYLSTIAKKYMDEDLIARRRDLDLLAVIAEVIVLSLIAFPIFLVIIITVMGFFGGSMTVSMDILYVFAFFVLPLLYSFFYILIKSTSIEKLTRLEPEKNLTLKKYYEENKTSILILLSSLFCMLVIYTIIQILASFQIITLNNFAYFDFAFLSILLIIGPLGFYKYLEFKKKQEMQDRLPDFLIEVGDSLSSGMNIFEAVKVAEKGHYGKLDPEIKKMKSQLSWNITMKSLLYDFADRMKTAIVHRIIIVLEKGLHMGGETHKIFKAMAAEVEQINYMERQRKSIMSIYALVTLVCFFVFLAIIMILNNTIFQSFFDIQSQQVGRIGSSIQFNFVDPEYLKYTLFSFVFVQSIGAGMLAGFMMDGRLSSGSRISLILGLITIFVFKILM